MTDKPFAFNDGAAYEQMMGKWSRLVGEIFVDWLAPSQGLRWIDVGCGNGAFTELLVERCVPAAIEGIDPSEGQLTFARSRHTAGVAKFQRGDAMALPFTADSFDAAVMALVIFFVPDPAKGLAEMVRVVRPGGLVTAYAWDLPGGGFPLEPVLVELRALGIATPTPPSADVSRTEALRTLWSGAGLIGVESRVITVQRTFANFDEFWSIMLLGSSIRASFTAMPADAAEALKVKVRARLPADSAGRITYSAFANAIKGHVPA